MKKAKWIGHERFIPNIGQPDYGSIIEGPEDVIDSFIDQGLAEEIPKEEVKRKVKEETE